MKRRLYISIYIFVFIFLSIFTGVLGFISLRIDQRQLDSDIKIVAEMVEKDLKNGSSIEALTTRYSGFGNITFIDLEGKVIASSDSAIDGEKSLLLRNDVQEALRNGEGSSIRHNDNLSQYFQYKVHVVGDYIMLIATPMLTSSQLLLTIIEVIGAILLLTALIGYLLSRYLYKKNIKPIETLDRYMERKSKDESTSEVEIRNLPYELKLIAKKFKKTNYKLNKLQREENSRSLYLYTAINSMEEGFIALDEEDKIKLINDSALHILDISGDINREDNILIITQNLDLVNAINKSRKKDKTINKNIDINNKTYNLSIQPLVKGRLILLRDITELNKIELLRKGFVSNVTHELKTPLTSIKGYIETLKNGGLEDKENANKFLNILDGESSRLEGLIDDILVLSNIENTAEIKLEDINVKDEVASILKNYEESAKIKNITLESNIPEDVTLKVNKELFNIMISNLVNNSIKYGEVNGSTKVNCYPKKKKVVLEVEDSGLGIADEDKERIFERFFKVDKSRSQDPASTGLGLSIVKHIAILFGGNVGLESELGKGSKFYVELPFEGRMKDE